MSSFLCFICHSTVTSDTNEDMREKYREVVGMHLCPDSHLCYICCHVLNKLWLFRAICLKRSLEYPVLFSEKGTLNLQRNDLEIHTVCTEDTCGQYHHRNINSKTYNFRFNYNCQNEYNFDSYNDQNHGYNLDNQYVAMDDHNEFDKYFQNDTTKYSPYTESNEDAQSLCHSKTDSNENNGEIIGDNENNNDVSNRNENNNGINSIDNDNQNINSEIVEETFQINPELNENIKELENNINENEVNKLDEFNLNVDKKLKNKEKKRKKKYEKIILSPEEQKVDIERRRKEKKYIEAEFKCYNCALGFLFKDTYQTHMLRHEESNGEYRCSTCTLRFASPSVLRSHTSSHGERYKCRRCNEITTARARRTHTRRCWMSTEGVSCHLCGSIFQDPNGLQQHLKRFHQSSNSNRSYPCSVCGKTYSKQAAVRTHMIKHINRKFNCDKCTSTFSNPYTLNQHKKKHDQTNSTMYYCTTCCIGYSTRKSLLAHKRNALAHQQTVFECPICSRVSPNQRSLTRHMESVHYGKKSSRPSVKQNGEKKRVALCHLCGANFKGNNKLNRHLQQVCEKAKLEEEFASLYDQECLNAT
ncbi:zinc finger protein 836-like [Hyposmocoma kahamanoa]|uniref:zinc finger protein 836-like n=1 Tax=Hyposmocoma kahamanoa TaxID=1477025 RepID=UPI000E6D9ABE|nr:zinc finger protein 836-like [Hyposmocoma kahamanoa]